MQSEYSALDAVPAVLRVALFVLAVLLAIVALLDWMVRTRRINAFNPIARFLRRTVDPLLRPIERRVVAHGGMPTAAPWWALGVVVVGGIILLTLIDFLGTQIAGATRAAGAGPRAIATVLISWTFGLLKIALIVRVVSSWIRISPYSKWVYWSFWLTEPLLGPLRRWIPTIGMIDITPIVAYVIIIIVESFVVRLVL